MTLRRAFQSLTDYADTCQDGQEKGSRRRRDGIGPVAFACQIQLHVFSAEAPRVYRRACLAYVVGRSLRRSIDVLHGEATMWARLPLCPPSVQGWTSRVCLSSPVALPIFLEGVFSAGAPSVYRRVSLACLVGCSLCCSIDVWGSEATLWTRLLLRPPLAGFEVRGAPQHPIPRPASHLWARAFSPCVVCWCPQMSAGTNIQRCLYPA